MIHLIRTSSVCEQSAYAVSIIALLMTLSACSRPVESVPINAEAASAVAEAAPVEAAAGDWPWWRGPSRNGHAIVQDVPVSWSETENLIWRVPLPGRGHSTPIVVGDHIYLTTANDDDEEMLLLCLDRETGASRWEHTVHRGEFMYTHQKNSHASATPAWDGDQVLCVFMVADAIYVTAVDRDGQRRWQTNAGPFKSKHGYGSSPLIYRSLVIVNGDHEGGGYLAALNRATGEIAWRISRPAEASFASPIVAHLNGRDQLIMTGMKEVRSYHPVSGELLWSCEGPATTTANTATWFDNLIFVSGGWPEQNLFAIRADGSGEIVWRERVKQYVPSPLVLGDRLLATLDNNILRCYRAETGERLWVERLGERGFSASPTAVGETVYLPDETGNVFVFRAGDEFELLAENHIDGDGMASPVICGGRIYLRSSRSLYCIGKTRPMASTPATPNAMPLAVGQR